MLRDAHVCCPRSFLERLAQSISVQGKIDREIIEEGKDTAETTNETIDINSIYDIDEFMFKAIFHSGRVNINQAYYRRMPRLEDKASGQTGIGLSTSERILMEVFSPEFTYNVKTDLEWKLE